jgi:hypothetical protein
MASQHSAARRQVCVLRFRPLLQRVKQGKVRRASLLCCLGAHAIGAARITCYVFALHSSLHGDTHASSAARPAHPRSHDRHPRPLRHANPGRHGRRGDQGRATRRRQHAPRRPARRAGPERHLLQLQSQQALGGARPQERGWQGRAQEAAAHCRRVRAQHATGGDGQAGLHLQGRTRGQPAHHLRGRRGLRPARPLRRQAGLRRRDPGRLRLCRPLPDARRHAATSRCPCSS